MIRDTTHSSLQLWRHFGITPVAACNFQFFKQRGDLWIEKGTFISSHSKQAALALLGIMGRAVATNCNLSSQSRALKRADPATASWLKRAQAERTVRRDQNGNELGACREGQLRPRLKRQQQQMSSGGPVAQTASVPRSAVPHSACINADPNRETERAQRSRQVKRDGIIRVAS